MLLTIYLGFTLNYTSDNIRTSTVTSPTVLTFIRLHRNIIYIHRLKKHSKEIPVKEKEHKIFFPKILEIPSLVCSQEKGGHHVTFETIISINRGAPTAGDHVIMATNVLIYSAHPVCSHDQLQVDSRDLVTSPLATTNQMPFSLIM